MNRRLLLLGRRAIIGYLLRDEFTTNLAAGSVNGTAAEPGPGTRTVTDTSNCIIIRDDVLVINGNAGWGATSISEGAVTRQAGRLMAFSCYIGAAGSQSAIYGFFSQASELNYYHCLDGVYFNANGKIYSWPGNVDTGYTWATQVRYDIIIELKAAGSRVYLKGGILTDWTLISDEGTNATATLYPGCTSQGSYKLLIDSFHIPILLCISPSDIQKDLFAAIPTTRWLSVPLGANDQIAINNAFGLLPPTGGIVQLNNGDYILASVSINKSNPTIAGRGIANTLITRMAGTTTALILNASSIALSNIILRDFAIDGKKAVSPNATGGDLSFASAGGYAVTGLCMDNLYMYDSYYGIFLSALINPAIKNCTFANFGSSTAPNDGIVEVYLCDGALIQNNQISGFFTTGFGAIDLSGSINSIVELNTIQNCTGGGAAIEVEANSDGAIVRNNITQDNSGPAYVAAACGGTKADNVTFIENTSTRDLEGIRLTGTSITQIIKHFILRRNTIVDPVFAGINIPNWVQDVLIEDNDISTTIGTDKIGINIVNTDDIDILGGSIDGFDTGISLSPTATNINIGGGLIIRNCAVGIINNSPSAVIDLDNITFINCGVNVQTP